METRWKDFAMKHARTHLTTLLAARSPGIYNLDACGKDYIVRNNHFGPQRRHALLARASGGRAPEI